MSPQVIETNPSPNEQSRDIIVHEGKDLFYGLAEFLQDERLKLLADKTRNLSFNEYVMLWWTMSELKDVIHYAKDLAAACDLALVEEESNQDDKGNTVSRYLKNFKKKLSGQGKLSQKKEHLRNLKDQFKSQNDERVAQVLIGMYSHLLSGSLTPETMNTLLDDFAKKYEGVESQLDEISALLSDKDESFKEPKRIFDIWKGTFPRKVSDVIAHKEFFNDLTKADAERDHSYSEDHENFEEWFKGYKNLAERSKALSQNIAKRTPGELPLKKLDKQNPLFAAVNSFMDAHTAMVATTIVSPHSMKKTGEEVAAQTGIDTLMQMSFSNPVQKSDPFHEAAMGKSTGELFDFEQHSPGVASMSFKQAEAGLLLLPAGVLDLLTPLELQQVFVDAELVDEAAA